MDFYNFYQGKKFLVTGHTGFKRSWLAIWLKQLGADVYGYALPPYTERDNFATVVSDRRYTIKLVMYVAVKILQTILMRFNRR